MNDFLSTHPRLTGLDPVSILLFSYSKWAPGPARGDCGDIQYIFYNVQ